MIQPGAYSDSMTFVSNVSEDGPAYLAGMRPGKNTRFCSEYSGLEGP